MADNFPSQGRGGADVDEEIPQDADRKSKKRRKAHKKAEKLRQELEKLSPKDRVGLARNAAITGVSAREVEFEGRTVSFLITLHVAYYDAASVFITCFLSSVCKILHTLHWSLPTLTYCSLSALSIYHTLQSATALASAV